MGFIAQAAPPPPQPPPKPFLCRTIGSNRRLEQMGRAAVSNCHWLIHGLLDFLDGLHTMSLSQFRGDAAVSNCHWLIHGLLDFLDGLHTMSLSQFRGDAAVSNCHWLIHGLLDFLDGIHTMSLSQFRGDTDLSDGRLAQPKARRARPRQVQSTCEQHVEIIIFFFAAS